MAVARMQIGSARCSFNGISSCCQPAKQLCELADQLLREAFSPHDPELTQESMSVEDYAAILAKTKPAFIHHPRANELIPQIIGAAQYDLDKSSVDVHA